MADLRDRGHEATPRRNYILLLRGLRRFLEERWPARSEPSFLPPSAVAGSGGSVTLRGDDGALAVLLPTLRWLSNCGVQQTSLVGTRLSPEHILRWNPAALAHNASNEYSDESIVAEMYPPRIDSEIERLSAGLEPTARSGR